MRRWRTRAATRHASTARSPSMPPAARTAITNSSCRSSARRRSAALAYSSNYAEYAPSRVSYRLDLRGESMAVQTACSSSLVGIHMACQSLLSGSSDMALAGG
ncbi:MAG: hypothetical protein HPM95_15925 [Alphaproteobacteria bacterium]|nr:hypothetical protein [Alphaproteobacteria bacterium]